MAVRTSLGRKRVIDPFGIRVQAAPPTVGGYAKTSVGKDLLSRRRPDSNRGITDLQSAGRSDGTPQPARDLRKSPEALAPHLPHDTCKMPPDLAALVEAWPALPEAIRAGILAMVRAASGGS
jgi:hypothetical protein